VFARPLQRVDQLSILQNRGASRPRWRFPRDNVPDAARDNVTKLAIAWTPVRRLHRSIVIGRRLLLGRRAPGLKLSPPFVRRGVTRGFEGREDEH